ncbi:MAG: KTSC domain-containing protein [Raineya sp.]|nr:KTSC domain-containing protein [Raineya sp.]MDW8295681.1 KTSC domain-containing protein [Raineya sp.]
MKRIAVESSMIASVGYDEENEILEVEFNSGQVYQYFEVPREVFDELLQAESKGRYMKNSVIDCYPYTKVKKSRRK